MPTPKAPDLRAAIAQAFWLKGVVGPAPVDGLQMHGPEEFRTCDFRFRMTPSENALLRANAETAGMTVSAYLMARIKGHRIDPIPPKLDSEAVAHLGRMVESLRRALQYHGTPIEVMDDLADLKAQIANLARRLT